MYLFFADINFPTIASAATSSLTWCKLLLIRFGHSFVAMTYITIIVIFMPIP